jgi:hypothetical protein
VRDLFPYRFASVFRCLTRYGQTGQRRQRVAKEDETNDQDDGLVDVSRSLEGFCHGVLKNEIAGESMPPVIVGQAYGPGGT